MEEGWPEVAVPYDERRPNAPAGYNASMQDMGAAIESIPITLGREDDGRWWADIECMPGVMAYGATRDAAVAAVRALALRVAADCIDHNEAVPEAIARVFSFA